MQIDLKTLSVELNTPSESLSRLLFHNAAMASGELFHSNVLAFLIEATRPTSGEHELLQLFLLRCGAQGWPTSAECLGVPRATLPQLRESAEREVANGRLNHDLLDDLSSFREVLIDREPSESVHRLTQREAGNFDLVINLHQHGSGRVTTRKRPVRKGALVREGLDALIFSLEGCSRFRLAIENKVKSIATRRQIDDYLLNLSHFPGQSRLVLLTLFPFEGSKASLGNVPLTILTYQDLATWLRTVAGLASVQQNAPWIMDYIGYIDALVGVSDRVWTCILASEQTPTAMQNLDKMLEKPLTRCRMLASYQKLRASRMAFRLEKQLEGLLPFNSIRSGDPWPTKAHLEIYSDYSNQTGMFGAVLVRPRKVGKMEVLEAVGVQYQNGEYRPYVSWDWVAKEVAPRGTLSMIAAPLTAGHVESTDLIDARARDLKSLLTDDRNLWRKRVYDHRWRGFVRAVEEPPAAILERMTQDIRRLVLELN